jgi:hypothetical protein
VIALISAIFVFDGGVKSAQGEASVVLKVGAGASHVQASALEERLPWL